MANEQLAEKMAVTVQQGATIVQIENDTQRTIAIQRPRDEEKVLRDALKELELYPQFAEKAYYVIPYKDRSDGQEKIVNVEGPSIKAAMALGRRWGNAANGGRIIGEDANRIQMEGVFLDYETNFRTVRPMSISKVAWNKKAGKVIPLRDDRLNMAIQAGASKAIRNAILAALPVGLVEEYTATAKKIAASGVKRKGEAVKPVKERMDAMYKAFAVLGAQKKDVDAYLAEHHELENDEAVLAHMIGVYNAIDDNQASLEEVFTTLATTQKEPLKEPQRATAASASQEPVIGFDERKQLDAQMKAKKISLDTVNTYLEQQFGFVGIENIKKGGMFTAVLKWVMEDPQIGFGE